MLPSLSVRNAEDQTRTMTEREKTTKQQSTVENSASGDGTVWFDRLSGGQRDESKRGACIFDSGTSSHACLTHREKMDNERLE